MSTIKSSDEHLTLNADGSGKDIKFQSNGSEVASISDAGKITATNFAANADDLEIQSSTGEKMIKCVKDAQVNLYYDNSKKLATSSTGITVTGGVAIGGTGTANTLDDYEEGTYNAVISGGTSGTFNMDSNDTLAYTKVGRLVSVQGYIGVSSGSVSGNLRMTLPFTPTSLPDDAQYNFSSLFIANTGNTNSGQKYLFLTGDAYGWFYKVEDSGSASYMDNNDVDSAFQIAVSFTYITG
jgi:hypothetical protein